VVQKRVPKQNARVPPVRLGKIGISAELKQEKQKCIKKTEKTKKNPIQQRKKRGK
jgi:hypothetical protein